MLKEFGQEYLKLLKGDLAGINLTRIDNFEDFYHKQLLDSILPFENPVIAEKIKNFDLIVDIGFGGGFPLLPLAKTMPQKQFIGLEARNKKVLAVEKVAKRLKIANLSLFHLRSEKLLVDTRALITFKAVGTIENCLTPLNIAAPVTALFYKGPNYQEESPESPPVGWELVACEEISVPNTEKRVVLLYENVPRGTFDESASQNVPRGTNRSGHKNVPRGTMGGEEKNVPRGTLDLNSQNVPRGTFEKSEGEIVPRGTISKEDNSNCSTWNNSGGEEKNVPRGTFLAERNEKKGKSKSFDKLKSNKLLVKLSELI